MPKRSQRRGGDFLADLSLGPSDEKKQYKKDVFEIARESKGGGFDFDPYAVQRTLRGHRGKGSSNKKHFWPKEFKKSRLRKRRRSEPVPEKKFYAQQVPIEDQILSHVHSTYPGPVTDPPHLRK